jgi:hypothetical protein
LHNRTYKVILKIEKCKYGGIFMSYKKGEEILYIKGTLNNETCFVHLYSNGIEIIIPPLTSTVSEKNYVYEFESIDQ